MLSHNNHVPIRAVIFDMDGLMLDTEPSYRVAWQRASAECGYPLSDAMYTGLTGHKTADAEKVLLAEFGNDFPLDDFRIACRKYEALVFSGAPFPKKPGLDELLAFLDSRHVIKAVATSTVRQRAIPQLIATNLLERFYVITTGDEVANGKPAPDLFLLAAKRLGVASSGCLVLEDSEPGVIAGHQAGMQVYLVPDLNPVSTTSKQLANAIFDSLTDVTRHLETASQGSNDLLA